MADLLFLKRSDGQIRKLDGDNIIHNYVEITREGYDHIETVEHFYIRLSLIEHDPCVKDRIMARLFLIPRPLKVFDWLSRTSDEQFEVVVEEFKDCLSYMLFPVAMEIERKMERRFGYGGALMRSLGHVPINTFSYFQREWFMGSKY